MTPVNIVDLSYASSTIQNVSSAATPIFASTIQPAAVITGIGVGGVIVAAIIAAIWAGISNALMRRNFNRKTELFGEEAGDRPYISL